MENNLKKNLSSEILVETVNFIENRAALFLTTPQLLTPLSILSNDSGLIGDPFYNNQSGSLYANADKIYGQKILKMNESVFTGLFRHAEKVRVQNHVQEKMLHEKVNGHKGIEKKLHQNLTKIERARQNIEDELYYMEKEMILLGLSSPVLDAKRKKNSEPKPILKSNSVSNETCLRRKSSLDFEIPRKNSLPLTDSDLQTLSQKNSQYDPSIIMKRITRKGNSVSCFSNEPLLKYKPKIRKYSLGNNPISQNNNNSTNLKTRSINCNSSESLIKSGIISAPSEMSLFGDTGTQSCNSPTPSLYKTTHKTSTPTVIESAAFSQSILQLPKIDQIHADRRKKSRKVSFTQIDLNELEIPKTLKHSNAALEKYKFNPNYYLPDGSLKAKFLLPQLKDTIESVKNCRYIRQFSSDKDQELMNNILSDFDVVKYIFHEEIIPTIN